MSENSISISVNVTLVPTPQFVGDMIVTAVEGGINYWATIVSGYRNDADGYISSITILDREGEEGEEYVIDRTAILRGMKKALEKPEALSSYAMRAFLLCDSDGEYDFDSDVADMVVQYGVLGERVYG